MQNNDCSICKIHSNLELKNKYEIVATDHWLIRHHPEPYPLNGWLLLDSQRHIQDASKFTHDESLSWGVTVKKATDLVKEITKCDRVYLIAFGEGAPHLHLHLIPRFIHEDQTKAWAIADYYRNITYGNIKHVKANEVKASVEKARKIWT